MAAGALSKVNKNLIQRGESRQEKWNLVPLRTPSVLYGQEN